LELDDSPFGIGAEDAIDPARVEAQLAQPTLQLMHILAADHRSFQIQEPITEPIAGLVQIPPGLGPDLSVGRETPVALECAHGLVGGLTELAPGIRAGSVAQRQEPVLNIPDRLS
jgi:hypothetical protein